MPGKFEIADSSVDVSNFAFLPMEGYLWITTLKLTSTEGKKKKLAMCIRIDTKVTKIRETKRGNQKS